MLKQVKQVTHQTLVTTRKMSTSSNWWTNFTSLILSFLVYIGVSDVPDAGDIIDSIGAQDWAAIIIVVINLVNKVIHIFDPTKIKEYFWEFLKSSNFYTNLLTMLIGIIVSLGAIIPDNAVSELVDSILGGDLGLILAAIAINIINPIYHLLFKKDTPEPVPAKVRATRKTKKG